MYRSRTLTFLLAMFVVLGAAAETWATTYTWTVNDWRQPFKLRELWQDEHNASPATNELLDALLSDASLGAVFQTTGGDMRIAGRSPDAPISFTVNAPFHFRGDTSSVMGMCFRDQMADNANWTFNNLYFQGTISPYNTGFVNTRLAGFMTVTGPMAIGTNSEGPDFFYDIEKDASRIDQIDVRWIPRAGRNNLSLLRFTNRNTAFWGRWVLTTRLFADVPGALGDADIQIEASDRPDGINHGILVVNDASAISPTAELTLVHDPNNMSMGILQNNHAISVRRLVRKTWHRDVNEPYYVLTTVPAGTYTASSPHLGGHMTGSGTITVADVDA
ncbi:MAG TPA: hypothetical protein VLH60_07660, partial [Sedimentisphaerales bacterium]|nr:hypothetical protein [Sedimentisphaerales bacterium]